MTSSIFGIPTVYDPPLRDLGYSRFIAYLTPTYVNQYAYNEDQNNLTPLVFSTLTVGTFIVINASSGSATFSMANYPGLTLIQATSRLSINVIYGYVTEAVRSYPNMNVAAYLVMRTGLSQLVLRAKGGTSVSGGEIMSAGSRMPTEKSAGYLLIGGGNTAAPPRLRRTSDNIEYTSTFGVYSYSQNRGTTLLFYSRDLFPTTAALGVYLNSGDWGLFELNDGTV